MNLRMRLATAAAGGLLALVSSFAATARARTPNYTATLRPPSMEQAAAFDRETRHMYQYVAQSLVEVHLSRDVANMLPPPLRHRFIEWEEHWVAAHHFRPMRPRPFSGRSPSITIRPDIDHGQKQKREPDGDNRWLKHLQKNPIGQLFLLQRFLVMKLHAFGNPHLMPILEAVHLRIESYHDGLRNRVYGLVTGQHGHVLVLSVLGVGASNKKIAVTTPDGRTCMATVLGVDFHRDITELQLPARAEVPGITLAPRWPRQAEMVLAINGGSPGIKWVHLCGQMHWNRRYWHHKRRANTPRRGHFRRGGNRINSFFQMVHLPRFFIDVKGRLVAVSSSNRAMVMGGKFSILRQFIETGFATGPRFGIKYQILPPHSKLRSIYPAIAAQPAALMIAWSWLMGI